MVKVLQVGATNVLGGIEIYLHNYYKNIDDSKVKFDFVNMYDKIYFQEEYESSGAKIYNLPDYRKHPIKYTKELKRILISEQYHVLHFNMNSAIFLYPLIAAKSAKTPIIIAHSHNSSSDKGIVKEVLHNINKKFIPMFANYYFACSEKAGQWFFSKKIMASNRFKIIYNAINIKKYQFDDNKRKQKREELGIGEDTIVLGNVGRFNKQKNHTFLIDIFKEYHKKYENSILILVGKGPLEDTIKKKVLELGIEKNVMFLGQRSDVDELYQVMDLFLLPSLYEGLPLVGVEAQVSGARCFFGNNISKEIGLTQSSMFLEYDAKKWVEEMKDIIHTKEQRIDSFKALENGNFNIIQASNELCDIYKGEK